MKMFPRTLALGLALAACAGTAQAASRFNIQVTNFKFSPLTVTCNVGDTLRFFTPPTGVQLHTATNGTGATDPAAGTLFDFDMTGNNVSEIYIVTTPGSLPVFCRTHESVNMKMTVTVNGSVNHPPVINTIPNQVTDENQLLTVTPSASDADGDVLTWSGSSLPSGASVSPSTGALTWTPTFSQSGVYPGVTLTANDGHTGVTSVSFQITVNNVNRAPSLTSVGNRTVAELQPLTIIPSASDPDGDALTYSATGLPGAATLNTSTGQIDWTPQPSDVGSVSHVMLTATDPGLLSSSSSFDITVTLDPSGIPVAGLPAPTTLGIASVSPNPFRSRAEIIVGSPVHTAATVGVWTVSGRQVAVLSQGVLAQGYSRFVWNGTDARGSRVAGGVYLVRVESKGRVIQQRTIKID